MSSEHAGRIIQALLSTLTDVVFAPANCLARSVRRSTTENVTGIRKMAMTEAASIPPMTAVPMMRRAEAPAPVANHSGALPRMNANAVIRMGRRRMRAPVSAASVMLLPDSYSDLANSTIRIAFFAANPISMTKAICVYTSFSKWRSQRVRKAPKTAIGVPKRTLKGSDQLSYCAARIRKTNSRESPKIAVDETPSDARLLLVRHACVVEAHLARHGLREYLLRAPHGLSGTVSGSGRRIDLRRFVLVVPHGEFRAADVLDVGNAHSSGTHAAAGVCHIELPDIGGAGSIVAFRFDVDLPLPAEAVEVIHKVTAHEGLHGLVDIADIHALDTHLGAVNVDIVLRYVWKIAGQQTSQLGAPARGGDEFLYVVRQELRIAAAGAIFEDECDATGGADSENRRRREGKCDAFLTRESDAARFFWMAVYCSSGVSARPNLEVTKKNAL